MPPHRPRRRFGQHFLTNPRILERIVHALDPAPDQPVLEIGPGQGALTAVLLERGARVTAIELDRDLVAMLRERFPALRLVEGDALAADWHGLMGPEVAGSRGREVSSAHRSGVAPFLLTGNIPYHITSPLLDKALTPPRPARIVFLVQREVAERLAAPPGSAGYGALTVGVQAVASVEQLFRVAAGAFHPPPRVDSAVVRLEPLAVPLVRDEETAGFRRLVTGLFGFRRKQLVRGLRELTGWPPDRVAPLLAGLGLDPKARPEVLEPAEFVALFRQLVDGGWANR